MIGDVQSTQNVDFDWAESSLDIVGLFGRDRTCIELLVGLSDLSESSKCASTSAHGEGLIQLRGCVFSTVLRKLVYLLLCSNLHAKAHTETESLQSFAFSARPLPRADTLTDLPRHRA